MDQHQRDRREKQVVVAEWESLRVAHFGQAGEILNLADQAKITQDASKYGIGDTVPLPPAFTTLKAAEDFAHRVISSYEKSNFIRPCFIGLVVEEKQYHGDTYFTPFVRVKPSLHAPGQPLWKGTLEMAELIGKARGESTDELRQHDGTYDDNHQRGRIMVNTHGHFRGILFVGGNSLNILVPPGVCWMLGDDGKRLKLGPAQ